MHVCLMPVEVNIGEGGGGVVYHVACPQMDLSESLAASDSLIKDT
jgi:hypothetical protein